MTRLTFALHYRLPAGHFLTSFALPRLTHTQHYYHPHLSTHLLMLSSFQIGFGFFFRMVIACSQFYVYALLSWLIFGIFLRLFLVAGCFWRGRGGGDLTGMVPDGTPGIRRLPVRM